MQHQHCTTNRDHAPRKQNCANYLRQLRKIAGQLHRMRMNFNKTRELFDNLRWVFLDSSCTSIDCCQIICDIFGQRNQYETYSNGRDNERDGSKRSVKNENVQQSNGKGIAHWSLIIKWEPKKKNRSKLGKEFESLCSAYQIGNGSAKASLPKSVKWYAKIPVTNIGRVTATGDI